MEYVQLTSLILSINPPSSHDFFDVELTLDEVVRKVVTMNCRSREYTHHTLLFLPEMGNLYVYFQINTWPNLSNVIPMNNYYRETTW